MSLHTLVNEVLGTTGPQGEPTELFPLLGEKGAYPFAQGWRMKAAPDALAPISTEAPTTPTAAPERVKVAGQTVDAVGKARIEVMENAAVKAGFALPPTWFAAGTDMMKVGEDKARTYATEHANLPSIRSAFEAGADAVAKENRRDYAVEDMSTARLDADGWLRINGRKVRLTATGLAALMGRFSAVGWNKGWAMMMSPSTRAAAITEGFERLGRLDTPRGAMLRIRDGVDGSPQLFAVVGPQFPGRATDADVCLRAALNALPTDARGEVIYDPDSTQLIARATFNAPVTLDAKVGDVFRGGVVFSTRDDGRGKWRGESSLTRIICINCTIASASVKEGERVHRGSGENFMADVARMTEAGMNRIAPIVAGWRDLATMQAAVVDTDGARVDGRDVLPLLVDGALPFANGDLLAVALKDAGIGRDVAVELLLRSYDEEAGNNGTMRDVINAVTRAAHQSELDVFQRLAMERAAGMLIPAIQAAAQ